MNESIKELINKSDKAKFKINKFVFVCNSFVKIIDPMIIKFPIKTIIRNLKKIIRITNKKINANIIIFKSDKHSIK